MQVSSYVGVSERVTKCQASYVHAVSIKNWPLARRGEGGRSKREVLAKEIDFKLKRPKHEQCEWQSGSLSLFSIDDFARL